MTLDTNIVIAYLNEESSVVAKLSSLKENGVALLLPTVVETEILAFPYLSPQERIATINFLEDHFMSIDFTRPVARIAADIRRETRLKFPDAAIAASALFTHTPLATRNTRDFKKIPNLSLVAL